MLYIISISDGDKVVSQPMQFFAAGVETTSAAISFTLYELCIHPQIQNKLREEILNYLQKNKEITYDNLKDLKYLEMCILGNYHVLKISISC